MRRAIAFAFAVLLVANVARAEPTAEALENARHTFDRALALEDGKRFDDALALFREVLSVKATPQVRFHVAYCLHKLGKLVDAGRELDHARQDAEALGPEGAPLAARAMQERTELYASTPRISVKLADGTHPATAMIDGAHTTLGDDPIAVDPGSHHVVVERPGKPTFVRDVMLAERRPAAVAELVIVDASSSFHVSPLVVVSGALAIATFGAAIVTGVLQSQLASKLETECGADHHQCPPTAQGDIDAAGELTMAANVLFVASAVTLVATTILFFATYKSHRPSKIALHSGLAFHF